MQHVQGRAAYLVCDIEHPLLNFVINFLGCVDERLLDILSCLGRCLQEDQPILLRIPGRVRKQGPA